VSLKFTGALIFFKPFDVLQPAQFTHIGQGFEAPFLQQRAEAVRQFDGHVPNLHIISRYGRFGNGNSQRQLLSLVWTDLKISRGDLLSIRHQNGYLDLLGCVTGLGWSAVSEDETPLIISNCATKIAWLWLDVLVRSPQRVVSQRFVRCLIEQATGQLVLGPLSALLLPLLAAQGLKPGHDVVEGLPQLGRNNLL